MKALLREFLPPWLIERLVPIKDFFATPYYRYKNVGKAAFVDPTVQVLGWRSVRVGQSTIISEGSWLNVNHRSGNEGQIVIGDCSYIGKRNFFTVGRAIHIGAYAMTGVDCHFIGSDHVFNDPMRPYSATETKKTDAIVIGSNCRFGARTTVLGNVNIGHGSVIGAGAFVTKSVPPFSLVVGNPARVIKRFDPISKSWIAAADFSEKHEHLLPDEPRYLEILKASHPNLRMPYKASGKSRGDLP